jgi:hypothetical protein
MQNIQNFVRFYKHMSTDMYRGEMAHYLQTGKSYIILFEITVH